MKVSMTGGRYSTPLVALVIVLFTALSSATHAQQLVPQTPRLCLLGGDGTFNPSWYPDGRVWTAQGNDSVISTLIMPVFMKNCWQSRGSYTAAPIYSFAFNVQYDTSALQLVDVLTRGPEMAGTHPNVFIEQDSARALSYGWNIAWNVAKDSAYGVPNGMVSPTVVYRFRGTRARITGQSSAPLAPTGIGDTCDSYAYKPLVFLKFRVLGRVGEGVSDLSVVYVTPDSIHYNGVNARTSPFPGDTAYQDPQPVRSVLGGVTYEHHSICAPYVQKSVPGCIYVRVHSRPVFRFLPETLSNRGVTNVNDSVNVVADVFVVDSAFTPYVGELRNEVSVTLSPDATRANDIIVESDQPWLRFSTRGAKNPIPTASRFGRIAYIDKGIIGPGGVGFPDARSDNAPGVIDPWLNLLIICDPVQAGPGIRTGEITFHSPSARCEVTRLRVACVTVRPPMERHPGAGMPGDSTHRAGVWLHVATSGKKVRTAELMFGTGEGAGEGVDSLYGECGGSQDIARESRLDARFVKLGSTGVMRPVDSVALRYGYGDLTARFYSREVQSTFDSDAKDTCRRFRCRVFGSSVTATDYPLVLTWSKNQIPTEGRIYLRDTAGGKVFSFLLKDGTPVPGGNGDLLSYSIRDTTMRAFDIWYYRECGRITSDLTTLTADVGDTVEFRARSSDTHATYRWQSYPHFGWLDLINAVQYRGVSTSVLHVDDLTRANNQQRFRCIITSYACTDTVSGAYILINTTASADGRDDPAAGTDDVVLITPHPVHDDAIVTLTRFTGPRAYVVRDMLGRVVMSGHLSARDTPLSLSSVPAGVYCIVVEDGRSRVFSVGM